tara:strand:- start:3392 stop:3997 length:606 start_codon:yes stop_codon:yes gene_type:complete
MDIKTIISLRKKINNLSFNLNNFNIFEKGIMTAIGISFFIAILFFSLNISFTLAQDNILLGTFIFICGFLSIPLFIHFSIFIGKFLLRKKTALFKFLFSNLLEGLRFNAPKYINKFLDSLTEEEERLLFEIQFINKKNKKSIDEILNNRILAFSVEANQKELDFVLDSIDDKELRRGILEISQSNRKQELNIVKQKIIKSI